MRVSAASHSDPQDSDRIERRLVHACPNTLQKDLRNSSTRRTERYNEEELAPKDCSSSKNQDELSSACHLRERNRKLEAIISDVMEVNKRWQKHHSERETYLQKLQNTVAELQQRELQTAVKETALPMGNALSLTPDRLAQIEADNVQLRLDLESANRKVQALEKEHHEHVQLLDIQVRSYRDDWEAERREKEQAIKDKAALEERCRKLEEQLVSEKQKSNPIEKSVMNIAPCGCPHVCESPSGVSLFSNLHTQCPRNKNHGNNTFRTSVHLPCGSNNKVKRRDTLESSLESSRASSPALSVSTESGIVTIGYEDGLASVTSFTYPETPRSVSSKSIEIAARPEDDFQTKTWSSPPKPTEEGVLTQTREEVVCPRCERIFPPDRHLDFIDHFDQCPNSSNTSVAHFSFN